MKHFLELAVICTIAVSGFLCSCNDNNDNTVYCKVYLPGYEQKDYLIPSEGDELTFKLQVYRLGVTDEKYDFLIESLELLVTDIDALAKDDEFAYGETVSQNGVTASITADRKSILLKCEPNPFSYKKVICIGCRPSIIGVDEGNIETQGRMIFQAPSQEDLESHEKD